MNYAFKPTTLYIKTHNITGLKYFGKTTVKDPHQYKGSGIHWKRHIKKHGNDVSTEIIGTFNDKIWCVFYALEFSKMSDIVTSKEWANLKPENGIDGGFDIRMGVMNGMFGKKHSLETRELFVQQRTGLYPNQETREKMSVSQISRKGENSWSQMANKEKFLTYDHFKNEVLKLSSTGLGYATIANLLDVSPRSVKTAMEILGIFASNQSWTKIKKRHPDFKFKSYKEFSEYCVSFIAAGGLVYHLQRQLQLSADSINRALRYK